jgi:hypothetical protein
VGQEKRSYLQENHIDRQLRPIAETLLSLANMSFDEIAGSGQMSLFP